MKQQGLTALPERGWARRRRCRHWDNHLPRQRRLVLDIGNFSAFASPILHVHEPRSFAFAYNFAVAGQSLGIGIGAAFAQPDERITVIVGDGGFMMACNEISTAARFNLPITFAVFNNGGYSEQRHVLLANGYPTTESELECADLERLAGGIWVRFLPGFPARRNLNHYPIRYATVMVP